MTSLVPLRVLVSAGELSGDEHAAHVVRALRALAPNVQLRGMGGRNLRAAGVDTVVDSEKSASVMGFQELFGSLGKIFASMHSLKRLIDDWKPHLLIVTDYPDFHMRLAKYAKARGVKTLYYIPPKVWAWRPGRVKTIGALFDHIAAIFPFEPEFYARYGVRHITYVGHPMTSQINGAPLTPARRSELLRATGVPEDAKVIALFPGSRRFEIARHLPVMAAAVQKLRLIHPEVYGVVSNASTIDPNLIVRHLPSDAAIKTFSGDSIELLKLSDAAALKSGTSNLQAAFCGVPFVMCYWVTKAFETFIVPLLKLKEFSPVNIVRSGTAVELLLKRSNADELARQLEALLFDQTQREQVIQGLREVTERLAPPTVEVSARRGDSASETVAHLARELMRLN